MGVYDSVIFGSQVCGGHIEAQSKAGEFRSPKHEVHCTGPNDLSPEPIDIATAAGLCLGWTGKEEG